MGKLRLPAKRRPMQPLDHPRRQCGQSRKRKEHRQHAPCQHHVEIMAARPRGDGHDLPARPRFRLAHGSGDALVVTRIDRHHHPPDAPPPPKLPPPPENPPPPKPPRPPPRSEEHTSAPQPLMRISYPVLCLKKQHNNTT